MPSPAPSLSRLSTGGGVDGGQDTENEPPSYQDVINNTVNT